MGKRKSNTVKTSLNPSLDTFDESNEVVQMPMSFARSLIRQIVYNPKNTTSQKSYSYSLYTKENILKWIQSPISNEKNLRDASIYMYLNSMHYQRLIKSYAGLYKGAYVISPLGFEKISDQNARNKFKNSYYKNVKFLEILDVPSLMRASIAVAIRDGACYGVRWADKTSNFVQFIDPDICKISAVSNGTFLYSVDMSKIQGKLEFYPAAFTELYTKYLNTGEKYQEVPEDISWCIKGDSTIVDFSTPLFASVMPSLYTIANTESLMETASELKNYKMLTGKVPVDTAGNPLIGWDLYLKYYNQLSSALGENVGLAITPFDINQFSFEERTGISDINEISKSVENFWTTAGTSGLLHGVANDTSGVTKLSIKNDETYVLDMVSQVEKLVNRYLKTALNGTYKFKITILPITVFNEDEYVKKYKEAAMSGLAKSHYAASIGIPQYDIEGLTYLENEIIPFDSLVPMKSTYTGGANEAGRPSMNDEDLSDEGEATRGNDTNANR